jgi:hypothetical protein
MINPNTTKRIQQKGDILIQGTFLKRFDTLMFFDVFDVFDVEPL